MPKVTDSRSFREGVKVGIALTLEVEMARSKLEWGHSPNILTSYCEVAEKHVIVMLETIKGNISHLSKSANSPSS